MDDILLYQDRKISFISFSLEMWFLSSDKANHRVLFSSMMVLRAYILQKF